MERYTGDVDWFKTRSLGTSAGFFAPYLRPGLKLLDCGCGPGSITLDFAEALDPGEVVGVDVNFGSLEKARAAAVERGVKNVTFELGDILSLPFPDASFDAVWTASTLQYLEWPETAAREILRVLKPGGVIGARDRNYHGDILGNATRQLMHSFDLYYRWNDTRGIHLDFGGQLRAVLMRAGFRDVQTTASYESNSSRETVRWTADRYAYLIPLAVSALDLTMTEDGPGLAAAWKDWGEDEASYFCMARCEAVAWKPQD